MSTTTITVDTSGLGPWKDSNQSRIRTALYRAGTDAQRRAKAEGNRQIKALKPNIRTGAVTRGRVGIKITRPTSTKDVLVWRVMAGIISFPVWGYTGGQKTPTGWSVSVKPNSRTLIPHAFKAKMKSGHVGVFMRYGNPTRVATSRWKGHERYAGKKRQPIREVYTSGISPAFKEGIPAMAERAHSAFIESFTRNMRAK